MLFTQLMVSAGTDLIFFFFFFTFRTKAVAVTRQCLKSTMLKQQKFWQTKLRFGWNPNSQIPSSMLSLGCNSFAPFLYVVGFLCSLTLFLCLGFADCRGCTHLWAAFDVVPNSCECYYWFLPSMVGLIWCRDINCWCSFCSCLQAKYWKQYVEAHMAVNNDDATKQIFSRCLLNCLHITLWYIISLILLWQCFMCKT